MTKSRISKTDAAVAQLDESIYMYFNGRDPLAAHTVAAAAYEILHDLHDDGLIECSLKDFLGREEAKKLMDGIRDFQNFLKHADRDPGGILNFDPGATEYLLQAALFIYVEHVGGKLTPNMKAYENWFVVCHPEVVKRNSKLRPLAEGSEREGLDKLSRREFYRQSVKAYHRYG